MGAFIQLADDLHDEARDRANGIANFVTTAESRAAAERIAGVLALRHIRAALKVLTPEERIKFRALGTIVSCKWNDLGRSLWLTTDPG